MFYRKGSATATYGEGIDRTNSQSLPTQGVPDTFVHRRTDPIRNVGDPMPAAKPGPDATIVARDARRLSTLLEVSQALSGTLNLKSSMQRVLQILIRHHGVVRGMVTLLREGELHVEAIEGFDDRARTISYKVGEGITGQVAQSGKPIVVPRVSKEPEFLNRMPRRADVARNELSFICVPIVVQRATTGTLAVDLKFKAERDYESSVKFFGIVSSMIAQALNVQR